MHTADTWTKRLGEVHPNLRDTNPFIEFGEAPGYVDRINVEVTQRILSFRSQIIFC